MNFFKIKLYTWTLCVMWIIFYFSTLFINNYHFTRYSDIKILNNSEVVTINSSCTQPEHSHYHINTIKVEFSAKSPKGEIKRFNEEFVSKNDGVYEDLMKGEYKEFNVAQSLISWAPLIFLFVLSIIFLIDEAEKDYDDRQSGYITQVEHWVLLKRFLGGNTEVVDEVADEAYDEIKMNTHNYYFKGIAWNILNERYDIKWKIQKSNIMDNSAKMMK